MGSLSAVFCTLTVKCSLLRALPAAQRVLRGRRGCNRHCSPVGSNLGKLFYWRVEDASYQFYLGCGSLHLCPEIWAFTAEIRFNTFHTAQYQELVEKISGRVVHNSVLVYYANFRNWRTREVVPIKIERVET